MLVDAGESAKSPQRPGMTRLLASVEARAIDAVIISKLDRLTRSVADLAELLKRFERRGVSLVSVGDALDSRSAGERLGVEHHDRRESVVEARYGRPGGVQLV